MIKFQGNISATDHLFSVTYIRSVHRWKSEGTGFSFRPSTICHQ